jgi:hypothetical protein
MTIEFQYEYHAEHEHSAMAQLSGHYEIGVIRQLFADMHKTTVTLRHLTSKNKPREFSITAAEADAFCEAWAVFKDDIALCEAIEEDRKKRAEQAEHTRQLAVWKEVEQLAESIPGLEILARGDDRWDEDTEEYVPSQAWTVKHEAIGYSDMHNHNVDQVFISVQETIEIYNQRLKHYENMEKENWEIWWPGHIENAKKFLATHRAFVASKTAPLVDVNA